MAGLKSWHPSGHEGPFWTLVGGDDNESGGEISRRREVVEAEA